MSSAQHAGRILAAWNVADPALFQTELESALHGCQRDVSTTILEVEQQELLESVVQCLRNPSKSALDSRKSTAQGLSAGFVLLQHLSQQAVA